MTRLAARRPRSCEHASATSATLIGNLISSDGRAETADDFGRVFPGYIRQWAAETSGNATLL